MIFFLLQFFIGSLSSSSIFRAHRLCFVYSLPAQIFEHSIIFAQGKKCCLQATEIFHFSLIHSNIFSKTGPPHSAILSLTAHKIFELFFSMFAKLKILLDDDTMLAEGVWNEWQVGKL